jgi:hypothetical protein
MVDTLRSLRRMEGVLLLRPHLSAECSRLSVSYLSLSNSRGGYYFRSRERIRRTRIRYTLRLQ